MEEINAAGGILGRPLELRPIDVDPLSPESCQAAMVRREQHYVTRRISMATRKELVEAVRARYSSAPPGEKAKILDEFVALTGYHRKHAIRVLREEAGAKETRARNRLYDEAVRQALTCDAGTRECGGSRSADIGPRVPSSPRAPAHPWQAGAARSWAWRVTCR